MCTAKPTEFLSPIFIYGYSYSLLPEDIRGLTPMIVKMNVSIYWKLAIARNICHTLFRLIFIKTWCSFNHPHPWGWGSWRNTMINYFLKVKPYKNNGAWFCRQSLPLKSLFLLAYCSQRDQIQNKVVYLGVDTMKKEKVKTLRLEVGEGRGLHSGPSSSYGQWGSGPTLESLKDRMGHVLDYFMRSRDTGIFISTSQPWLI